MSSYVKYRDEVLNNNPELKAEYDALAPEYDIIQAIIDEGKAFDITQQELAERTDINVNDFVSKI